MESSGIKKQLAHKRRYSAGVSRVESTLAMAGTPTSSQALHGPAVTPPSTQGSLSNSTPTDDFVAFVRSKENEYKGRDGLGQEQHYIPHTELLVYWNIERIRDACESYSEAITTRPRLIKDQFLRVFSTLVFIGKLSFLKTFQRHELWDEKFPSPTLPGPWDLSAPSHRSIYDDFTKHQWRFFPVILDRNRLDDTWLPPERILPLRVQATIREQPHGDGASITKVHFHPSCNNLDKNGNPSAPTLSYVLKTYYGQQHEQHYRHESRAFARFLHNPNSPEHVVKCYATFKHGETYNLVMEWVAGGDLLEYFQKTNPPRTLEDITDFWESLWKLNIGLDRIHQIIIRGERPEQYQLVHQDIKPDNILLDIRTGSRPYQFSPIIADLGHSHIRHIKPDSPDIPAIDHRGNQMYCAPESSRHAGFRRTGPNGITSQADIFSAGAVLSDAASWVAKGEAGRTEYFDRRRKQLDKVEGFALSGYETAFHNGSVRLSSVDAMHHEIRSIIPSYDTITPRVLDIIEQHMLVLPKDRSRAKLLYTMFETEIQTAKAELFGEMGVSHQAQAMAYLELPKSSDSVNEASTPPPSSRPDKIWSPPLPRSAAPSISTDGYSDSEDTFSPMASPSAPKKVAPVESSDIFLGNGTGSPASKRPNGLKRPFTSPNQPPSAELMSLTLETAPRSFSETSILLSMEDAAEYRRAMKARERVDPRVLEVIKKLHSNLERRDHLFFIDDTDSMKEHSAKIQECFQTLAYIAKSIDPDSLELSFVSKPLHTIKSRSTHVLANELRDHLGRYGAVTGRIESSLSDLVTEKIIKHLPVPIPLFGHFPRPKPITIFVFTDGKWGDGVHIGNGLDSPISRLMAKMKKRDLNRTDVMFQFLRFGNDTKGKEHLVYLDSFGKKEKWDIVDTRDINGDVYSMFLATLTENNDINNDRATVVAP